MSARIALSADLPSLRLFAAEPVATDDIGRALAPALSPGDVIALHGPLGAGKSQLARAVIRARLGDPTAEVPSPTYTLVNVYSAPGGEIWHADLYRIDPEELGEIGLSDALGHAILLVEWAGRWPDIPARHLGIRLTPRDGGRSIAVTPSGPGWERALCALRSTA